jgi:purine-binding chemotaxis protein CheW
MSTTHQLCTFRVAGLYMGVEVTEVSEVLRLQQMTPVPLSYDVVAGLVNLRGEIVTALDLRRRLGFERFAGGAGTSIVLRSAGETMTLLIDEIGDVVTVDDDDFEPPPETVGEGARDLIRGAYKLEGSLLLLLDIDRALALPAA